MIHEVMFRLIMRLNESFMGLAVQYNVLAFSHFKQDQKLTLQTSNHDLEEYILHHQ
jgi:hypothetical protein